MTTQRTGPAFAISLPYRAPENLAPATIREVAVEAEAAGFDGLWVSERTIGTVFCLDPIAALSHVAAVTSTIRLGVAVVVSPVHNAIRLAHQYASLDYLSGGRVTVGVGLGRDAHYDDFGVSKERRVRRFLEGIDAVKRLWSEDDVTYHGDLIRLDNISVNPKPVQRPRPSIWFGGSHSNALRRAARFGDGWIGPGLQRSDVFAQVATSIREQVRSVGNPDTFVISKRVYVAISDDRQAALTAMRRWFGEVLGRPDMIDCGLTGTADEVRAQLEPILEAEPDHLLLHPVSWSPSTVDDLQGLTADFAGA